MGKMTLRNKTTRAQPPKRQKLANFGILRSIALKKSLSVKQRVRNVTGLSPENASKTEKTEQRSNKNTSLNGFFSQGSFECPVCLELMIEPTLLECGHAYCGKCLEELMMYKSTCGVCRNFQTEPEFQKSKVLEDIIEKQIIKQSQNYLDYYCRVADNENWKAARDVKVADLTKGSYIDFRDSSLKWRKGEITRFQTVRDSEIFKIAVIYAKDGQKKQEVVRCDSKRIAKFRHYTRIMYRNPIQAPNVESLGHDEWIDIPLPLHFPEERDDIEHLIVEESISGIFEPIEPNLLQQSDIWARTYSENEFQGIFSDERVPSFHEEIELLI